jgi:hypothetical protein
MTIKYLVTRDGREYVMDSIPDWAQDNPEYEVVKLSSVEIPLIESSNDGVTNTDDTAERIQLMDELFDLQQQEIDFLKHRLEAFVEVVEGIVELTDVISHSGIENRSKLVVIGDSCKAILKPSE